MSSFNYDDPASESAVWERYRQQITSTWTVPDSLLGDAKRLSREVLEASPEGTDAELIHGLQRAVLELRVRLDELDPESVDTISEVAFRVIWVYDVLREIEFSLPYRSDRNTQELSQWLRRHLPGYDAEMSRLAGVSPSTLRAWAHGDRETSHKRRERLRQVVLVCSRIKSGFTDEGVISWWDRRRSWVLDNQTPYEALEAGRYSELARLACERR